MSVSLSGGFLTTAFNPLAPGVTPTVEYLVVAGGGGGGGFDNGGGGGAGGLLTGSGYTVTAGSSITVTVGAGGAGIAYDQAATNPAPGVNGNSSVFGSISTVGGGYGGSGSANPGVNRLGGNGGSGGGGGISGTASGYNYGGSAVPGQGYSGGTGSEWGGGYGIYAGAGGGGAGGAGGSGLIGIPYGGTGICSTITGERVFYAGGGAGGNNGYQAYGGAGGGGNGAINTGSIKATSGTLNTGGGGGGLTSITGHSSGLGGSGVVIIRYPIKYNPPASTTGSLQILYSSGYQIYRWTSSGTVTF